jgi:hypothetical protein
MVRVDCAEAVDTIKWRQLIKMNEKYQKYNPNNLKARNCNFHSFDTIAI